MAMGPDKLFEIEQNSIYRVFEITRVTISVTRICSVTSAVFFKATYHKNFIVP